MAPRIVKPRNHAASDKEGRGGGGRKRGVMAFCPSESTVSGREKLHHPVATHAAHSGPNPLLDPRVRQSRPHSVSHRRHKLRPPQT